MFFSSYFGVLFLCFLGSHINWGLSSWILQVTWDYFTPTTGVCHQKHHTHYIYSYIWPTDNEGIYLRALFRSCALSLQIISKMHQTITYFQRFGGCFMKKTFGLTLLMRLKLPLHCTISDHSQMTSAQGVMGGRVSENGQKF